MGQKFKAAGDTLTLFIDDEIGPSAEGYVGEREIRGALDQYPNVSEIVVRFQSPGGCVFESAAIYNALARHPATKRGIVDGLAASGASLILMACDSIEMAANSFLMIHKAWSGCIGNSDDMAYTAQLLEKLDENMLIPAYSARSGLSPATVRTLMRSESWFTAAEAVSKGLADKVGQQFVTGAAARVRAGRYKNTPKSLLDSDSSPTPQSDSLRDRMDRLAIHFGRVDDVIAVLDRQRAQLKGA